MSFTPHCPRYISWQAPLSSWPIQHFQCKQIGQMSLPSGAGLLLGFVNSYWSARRATKGVDKNHCRLMLLSALTLVTVAMSLTVGLLSTYVLTRVYQLISEPLLVYLSVEIAIITFLFLGLGTFCTSVILLTQIVPKKASASLFILIVRSIKVTAPFLAAICVTLLMVTAVCCSSIASLDRNRVCVFFKFFLWWTELRVKWTRRNIDKSVGKIEMAIGWRSMRELCKDWQ